MVIPIRFATAIAGLVIGYLCGLYIESDLQRRYPLHKLITVSRQYWPELFEEFGEDEDFPPELDFSSTSSETDDESDTDTDYSDDDYLIIHKHAKARD
jgi:hypothetical protein